MSMFKPDLPEGKDCFGLLAEFDTTSGIYHACEKVRDAGYTKWDAHTPFPVHGLDKAMGLRPSVLPWIVLVMGLTFAAGGMLMQWWMSAVDYKLIISGKPLFSWQAYVPITFELGVIGGVFGAVFGMFALNQLPTLSHPLFNSARFERFSDDRFFISVRSDDPKFNRAATEQLLKSAGAVHVEIVEN